MVSNYPAGQENIDDLDFAEPKPEPNDSDDDSDLEAELTKEND